jgi:hypothetical protein
MQTEEKGVNIRAHGVHIMQQQVLQLRALGEQPREGSVAQQVGNLETRVIITGWSK